MKIHWGFGKVGQRFSQVISLHNHLAAFSLVLPTSLVLGTQGTGLGMAVDFKNEGDDTPWQYDCRPHLQETPLLRLTIFSERDLMTPVVLI